MSNTLNYSGDRLNPAHHHLTGGATPRPLEVALVDGTTSTRRRRGGRRETYSKPKTVATTPPTCGKEIDAYDSDSDERSIDMTTMIAALNDSINTFSSSYTGCEFATAGASSSSSAELTLGSAMMPSRHKRSDSKDSNEKKNRRTQRRLQLQRHMQNDHVEIPNGSFSSINSSGPSSYHDRTCLQNNLMMVAALIVVVIIGGLIVTTATRMLAGDTRRQHPTIGASFHDLLAPRSSTISQELLDKLTEDSRIHDHELEALRKQLELVKQHEAQLEAELHERHGDNRQAQLRQESSSVNLRLRGANSNINLMNNADLGVTTDVGSDNDHPYPDERTIHLVNRSPFMIRVFWISQHVIDAQQQLVEWVILGGQNAAEEGLQPSTMYHFHAHPHHKFGIRKYTETGTLEDRPAEWEDLFYVVPGVDPEDDAGGGTETNNGTSNKDPFLIVTESWELDVL